MRNDREVAYGMGMGNEKATKGRKAGPDADAELKQKGAGAKGEADGLNLISRLCRCAELEYEQKGRKRTNNADETNWADVRKKIIRNS